MFVNKGISAKIYFPIENIIILVLLVLIKQFKLSTIFIIQSKAVYKSHSFSTNLIGSSAYNNTNNF